MDGLDGAMNDLVIAIENSIDYVVENIIDIMQQEIDAMGIGSSGEVYKSTNQFRESWTPMIKQKVGDIIEGGMEYNPSMMTTHDPANFIHGSNIFRTDDSREFLADIIFDGTDSTLWGGGWWTNPRDAFAEMEKYVDANIDRWFDQAMAKQGFIGGAVLL